MNKLAVQGAALVLALVAYPLTALGTNDDRAWMWGLGLITVLVAGAVVPLTRFVDD